MLLLFVPVNATGRCHVDLILVEFDLLDVLGVINPAECRHYDVTGEPTGQFRKALLLIKEYLIIN